jgi:Ca2+-binding EF-hand superfamily protein
VSDTKLAALQSKFNQFDLDHSGFIDSTELTDLLRALGFNPPKHRIECIIEDYDTDHNGNLSFGEFIEVWAMYCMEAETEMQMIRRAFSYFDFVRTLFLAVPVCS